MPCELQLNKVVKVFKKHKKMKLFMPHHIVKSTNKTSLCKNKEKYYTFRNIFYKTLLPPVFISTSVESLSKLPALLTIFIKWMAVQAKGMRYFPSLWQNCSA